MANEPRTGFYAGIHYLVEDGKAWYRGKDVEGVLGVADIESAEWLHRPEDDGVKSYIPAVELATIVDGLTVDGCYSPRAVWIQLWYDDLFTYVETGEALSDFLHDTPLSGDIADAMDAARAPGRRDLRADVRDVLGTMGLALQCLQDGVTYLDGFRSGALMASGDVPGMGGIQSLFVDLRGVEDEMSRIHSRLEDIANGGRP